MFKRFITTSLVVLLFTAVAGAAPIWSFPDAAVQAPATTDPDGAARLEIEAGNTVLEVVCPADSGLLLRLCFELAAGDIADFSGSFPPIDTDLQDFRVESILVTPPAPAGGGGEGPPPDQDGR